MDRTSIGIGKSNVTFVPGDIEELHGSLCLKLAQNLSPFAWWAKYGRNVVPLQSLYESAVKQILSVHHSSNIAEKDFSRRTFIQPKSRASLNSGRAVRMHNVRTGLLKERNSLYKDTGLMQFLRDPTKPPQHNESSPGKFSVIPQLPEEKIDNDFVFIPRSNILKKKKNKTQNEPEEVEEEIASDGTDEMSDEEWSDVSDLEDEDALVEKYYGNLTSEKLDQIEQLLEEDSEDEVF